MESVTRLALDATTLLTIFIVLRLVQYGIESLLAKMNRDYYRNPAKQQEARELLGISSEEMAKSLAYSEDKYSFSRLAGMISLMGTLVFLALGGFGWIERVADGMRQMTGSGAVVLGLWFFALLGLLSSLFGLPFEYYRTFVLEQKHGFNRQTPRGFWLDRGKGLVLAVALGAPILALILWLMQATGEYWWVYAWVAMSTFSILTAWLYPTFLAPLFNKFSPVNDQDLLLRIEALATKIGFRTAGIFVMDASKRTSHGNAYFTGVFGKKRIVLFDTLVNAMAVAEVVAVLAHELGHFKLHHVRWGLIRGLLMTGVTFYLLSLCLPMKDFYEAFKLGGVSNYGALIVFGMWFGILDFVLQPLGNLLSRRNEFAADTFAREQIGNSHELGLALLKLRETSSGMPISHPVFSAVYHSHPPLLERLVALGYAKGAVQGAAT